MDDIRSRSVIKVFVDLYNKGLIYRGVRMVNWDPQAMTAISDEEVLYRDEHSHLYHLRYYVEGEDRYIVVATTRPETILGDTAVCVNPNDERYKWLKGKRVIVPMVGRAVPVIMDEYVEMDFGTGCLKVTPAHDVNDYMLGEKYGLPSIDIFNDNGTISEAGGMYVGMDRFDVRRQIMSDLKEKGLVEKVEDYDNKVGYSERTKVVIEPKLSMQWFLKMDKLTVPALDAVMDGVIKFYPEKFKNTYRHWMTDTKDWCISRQLWWGHRIPAYFLPGNQGYVVAQTPEEALRMAQEKTGRADLTLADLRQDDDCLDTWFSSWLWPISLFNGILEPGNEELRYYYPTSDLVTGPDIIFFWVARMIIAGYEYIGKNPFNNVYFTGIVRDSIGRKMSKQLGNSPDPLDLIAQYGADGVRMGLMLAAPAGNDIMYDDKLCEQGRNFCNKIWNAFRLVKGWNVEEKPQPEVASHATHWFEAQLGRTLAEVSDLMGKFRISEALMAVYRLFWDEFSSWYLEMVKPAYGDSIDSATYKATIGFFDSLLRVLHPFMPFITEELWQHIAERRPGESIMYASTPQPSEIDGDAILRMEFAKEIVTGVRGVRAAKNIAPKEQLALRVIGEADPAVAVIVSKLANLSEFTSAAEKDPAASTFMVGTTEFNVPLADSIDVDAEIARLGKELDYALGFKASVEKKLSNERFVNNAPAAVVETERRKLADADSKIESLRASIAALKA